MEIIKKAHETFDNFTLNRKFTCIICFVLAMTVLGTGAGLWITYHSGNKLLYEATKESLDHSSSVIAERLSNIEDMTGMILADASIQSTLSAASDPGASDNDKMKHSVHYLIQYPTIIRIFAAMVFIILIYTIPVTRPTVI